MKKYPLWDANWNVAIPALPNVWKGEQLYIWQDKLVDAAPYGVTGSKQVDHDIWMTKIPFPDVEPPPPPPPVEDEIAVTIKAEKDGKIYSGVSILKLNA
jgi:hypothetical protein